ncbi:MAG: hypothetical protein ACJZ1Z_06370 [Acidimicrobiales bacterium]
MTNPMVEGVKPSLSPLIGNKTLWMPLPNWTKVKAKNKAHIPSSVLTVGALEEAAVVI